MRYFVLVCLMILWNMVAFAEVYGDHLYRLQTEKGIIEKGEIYYIDGREERHGRLVTLMNIDVYPDEKLISWASHASPVCTVKHREKVIVEDILRKAMSFYYFKIRSVDGDCEGWVDIQSVSTIKHDFEGMTLW